MGGCYRNACKQLSREKLKGGVSSTLSPCTHQPQSKPMGLAGCLEPRKLPSSLLLRTAPLLLTAFHRGNVSISRVVGPLRAAYGVTQFMHHLLLSAMSKGTTQF